MILVSERFGTVTVSPQIRRHDREVLGQHGGDQVPHRVGLWIAVQQQYRRPVTPVDEFYLGVRRLYSLLFKALEQYLPFRRPASRIVVPDSLLPGA
jgi:hypothetical protein